MTWWELLLFVLGIFGGTVFLVCFFFWLFENKANKTLFKANKTLLDETRDNLWSYKVTETKTKK